ncbi:MAG: hypothetical protein KKB20_13165 [Proteobacteria bacterium]|nr:hypothetical protein [Pseudomonadota bacterium]
MIYIHETFFDPDRVMIKVEGRVDRESLPSLREICDPHLKSGKRVSLDLKDITHINKEGLDYFGEIRDRVTFVDIPQFLKLDLEWEQGGKSG